MGAVYACAVVHEHVDPLAGRIETLIRASKKRPEQIARASLINTELVPALATGDLLGSSRQLFGNGQHVSKVLRAESRNRHG